MSFRDWEAGEDCPQLPSVIAVCDVLDGNPEGWPEVIKATASRSVMIGAGLFLAGERDWTRLVKASVISALVVEVWVVQYIYRNRGS